MNQSRIRIIITSVLVIFGAVLLLLGVHQLLLPVLAWFVPSLEIPFYDLAVYGVYPKQDYVSVNLSSPQMSLLRWDDRCNDGYLFFTPNGESVPTPGPMILDSSANLVWMSDRFQASTNLRIQKYRGLDYLTFWSGRKESSTGQGLYYMVRQPLYDAVNVASNRSPA